MNIGKIKMKKIGLLFSVDSFNIKKNIFCKIKHVNMYDCFFIKFEEMFFI